MDDQHEDRLRLRGVQRALAPPVSSERRAGVSAAALFPAWLPKIVMSKNYASNRDIIVSVFMRGGADGLSICVPFADAELLHVALDDRDSAARLHGGDEGHQSRRLLHVPAGDGGRRGGNRRSHAGVPGDGSARRARDRAAEQLALALRRAALHGSRQAGRSVARDGMARPTSREHSAAQARRAAARLGVANGFRKRSLARRRRCRSPIRRTTSIGGSATTQAQRLAFMQSGLRRRRRAGALGGARRDEHGELAQVGELHRLQAGERRRLSEQLVRQSAAVGRGADQGDVGIEAAQVDIGGWDTHSAQDPLAGSMFKTMQDFSNSLAAFYADVIATGFSVTVVAVSEFGRNVRENGSQGTDHGRGTTMFAMGKGIAGGRVLTKNWPGLARENLESGQDLKVTVDYRDILPRSCRTDWEIRISTSSSRRGRRRCSA